MPTIELTILAVSCIGQGVCVAGVTDDGTWIRPTRPEEKGWRMLHHDDCKNAQGHWVLCKGNRVSIALEMHIPRLEDGHVEDWLVADQPPRRLSKLNSEQYRELCAALSEDHPTAIEGRPPEKSLVMVHPERIESFSFCAEQRPRGGPKFKPRCTFTLSGRRYANVPISDAEWRGYGIKEGARLSATGIVDGGLVLKNVGASDCWFTLGGIDTESGRCILIPGVHLFPVRRFDMNFDPF